VLNSGQLGRVGGRERCWVLSAACEVGRRVVELSGQAANGWSRLGGGRERER
jgi:hypothetical protein